MSNWYYYDKFGNRNGPVDNQQLRNLVSQRVVVPETPIETDTGKKGLAKQIGGLFPKSDTANNTHAKTNGFSQNQGGATPVNYPGGSTEQNSPDTYPISGENNAYCTNCGASVMPNAVACMTCGAAPVGHRKFCRSCGTALNPEQITCLRCGTSVSKTTGTFQPPLAPFRNDNGNRLQTGFPTALNAQAGNPFSAQGNQFMPVQNMYPGSVPFNGQSNTFSHKQSGKKTILKVGIGIGIGLIVLIGAMIAHDKYQRDLKRAKGQVEKQIMEERHRAEMQQYLRNL